MDLITPPAIVAGTEPAPGRRKPHGGPDGSLGQSFRQGRAEGPCEHRPRRQSAAGQPTPEPLPPAGQPALDRPDGTAEVPRRLLVGAAFQVAEHHRDTIPLGQPVNLLVDDGRQVFPSRFAPGPSRHRDRSPFDRPAALGVPANPDRRMSGDSVQPRADRIPHPERTAPSGQDQERRLEGVAGVVLVAQDGQAGAQDHRTVPIDQGREGHLRVVTAPCRKALQQLTVGQANGGPDPEERAEPTKTVRVAVRCHEAAPPVAPRPFPFQ